MFVLLFVKCSVLKWSKLPAVIAFWTSVHLYHIQSTATTMHTSTMHKSNLKLEAKDMFYQT